MSSIIFKVFFLKFLVALHFVKLTASHNELPRLLMISFDGFRWDYLTMAHNAGRKTPNFDELISTGIQIDGDGIKNAFVTKTFPNHYTLATGLYEENHGIVSNYFYDSLYNATFSMGDSLDPKWWNGTGGVFVEPIWKTNEKASHGHPERLSGVFFWPGSEVKGHEPRYVVPYDKNISFTTRVDTVIGWFTTEDDPINLGLLYFNEPDSTGHRFGPNSPEILEMIVECDRTVGHLIRQLKEHRLFDSVNLIITSDHGMATMIDSVYVDDFVDPSLYQQFGSSPIWSVLPSEGQENVVYESLKKANNLLVFKKDEIPPDWHYSNSRRILPIMVSAVEGYRLCKNRNITCDIKGNHGYNNSLSSMHPIFIARGPAFKKNYKIRPFNSVDIYSLICHIINLTPLRSDGSLDAVKNMLAEYDVMDSGHITYIVLMLFASVASFVCCVGAFRSYFITTRRLNVTWRKNVPKTMKGISGGGSKEPLLEADEEEDMA